VFDAQNQPPISKNSSVFSQSPAKLPDSCHPAVFPEESPQIYLKQSLFSHRTIEPGHNPLVMVSRPAVKTKFLHKISPMVKNTTCKKVGNRPKCAASDYVN